MLRHLNVIRALVGAILAVSTLGLHAARAETVLTVSTLSFPTMLNIMTDIIMAKGFDTANGLKLQPVLYGSPGAQWAGIAKGEIILGAGSPYQAAKLREDKIPVSLLGTEVSMSVIQVVSRNPAVKSINDLRGRTLAATTGFSEYGYIAMYAKRMGLDLKKDTNLVDASTSLAQAQLQAGRADAIIVWEPSATMVLKQNPDAHVVVTGDEAWKKVSGEPGWDLFLYINTDWAKAHPQLLPNIIKMYRDAGTFMAAHGEEADAIISSNKYSSKNMPAGVISTGIASKRLVIDIQPAWQPDTNKKIWQMIKLGIEDGMVQGKPDQDLVINESIFK